MEKTKLNSVYETFTVKHNIYPEKLKRFCNSWREIIPEHEIHVCRDCPIGSCCKTGVYSALALYPTTKEVLEDVTYILNNYPETTTLINNNLL